MARLSEAIDPELEALDRAFREQLAADPAPASTRALSWHEAVGYDPAERRVISRGPPALEYVEGPLAIGPVPGTETLEPKPRLRRALARAAAGGEGLRMVSFRYTREEDGAWSGGVRTETFAEAKETFAALGPAIAAMETAMRAHWGESVLDLTFSYGAGPEPEPTFRVGLALDGDEIARPAVSVPDDVAAAFDALCVVLAERGREPTLLVATLRHRDDALLPDDLNLLYV